MIKDNPRCTFAIISHPDAGKTTMTEKLLWFGSVVRKTGMVKSKTGDFAKSDWMEMEKKRGISITSSVMSFDYNTRSIHLLDTPGHKDFSEDTYRTLTAVESVLMMIDSAKGVEEQTKKLMEVCRMRDTPIVTFMNKFDRESLDPWELLEDVEKTCSIQCCPITWPIGMGSDFIGVYHITEKRIYSFKDAKDPFSPNIIDASDLTAKEVTTFIPENLLEKLNEDLELVTDLLPTLNKDEFLAGIQTPVFFGSALHNFGVKEVLDMVTSHCPGPLTFKAVIPPYNETAEIKTVSPGDKSFSGFVFKIQANMDKNHRDRIAFLRVCSGHFQRGEKYLHVRTGKEIKINTPILFQSRDRQITDSAEPGDIIGLNGNFQIGDTLTEGEKFLFTGIPRFAPEIFKRVILEDPLKAKQLDKGLTQLSEEGAVQMFTKALGNEKILGAVGALQFDVVKFRIEDEYNVRGRYESINVAGIRWLQFPSKKRQKEFMNDYSSYIVFDRENRPCYAIRDMWEFNLVGEKNEDIIFHNNSDLR
ncbi:peptide chain release factor 3 [Bacteriovoracaceae bacterium]|nr:peptide chain release factor 3 [Bacteriovoracaceae bacterium]